jgi:type I restriction-modification system DNA methylase subunit
MQSKNLDFTVGSFGKREDSLIDGAAGDGEFLLDSAKELEGHNLKTDQSITTDKNDYVNS